MQEQLTTEMTDDAALQRLQRSPGKRIGLLAGTIVINIIFVILVLITVLPFLYMMLSAFKPNSEIFGTPLTFFPTHPTFANMSALLTMFPFARWALNTAIVGVVGTTVALLLSSLAGFAFAKYNFRYKNVLFIVMLATLLLPYQVLLVPQFQIMGFLHWFNTYQGLIVPRAVSAFGIVLMRQYTIHVPNEMLDAARVDGSSEFDLWWRIVVPLVRPGLAVLGIFTFTFFWNDFFWPLIITTDPNMFVINLGISSLVGPYDYQYGILLSGTLLAALPIIIIFLAFQRQFIEGLTRGAFK